MTIIVGMMNATEKLITTYREQQKRERNEALRRVMARPCTREEMFARIEAVGNLYTRNPSVPSAV